VIQSPKFNLKSEEGGWLNPCYKISRPKIMASDILEDIS